MIDAKKIANRKYEEEACATTRTVSRHGVKRGRKRCARIRNRIAKRQAAALDFASQSE